MKTATLIDNYNNVSIMDYINILSDIKLISLIILIIFMIYISIYVFMKGMKESIYSAICNLIASIIISGICLLLVNIYINDKIQKDRLKEIVLTAQKENISEDLIITDNAIIYKDSSCSHKFEHIEKLVNRNNDNYWVYYGEE